MPGRARVASVMLFGRQSDAGNPGAVILRQGKIAMPPQPQPISRTCRIGPVQTQELGRDVPLLRGLRLLQRFVAAREVAAGVLAVPVKEQRVEPAAQVIVMGDVAGARA